MRHLTSHLHRHSSAPTQNRWAKFKTVLPLTPIEPSLQLLKLYCTTLSMPNQALAFERWMMTGITSPDKSVVERLYRASPASASPWSLRQSASQPSSSDSGSTSSGSVNLQSNSTPIRILFQHHRKQHRQKCNCRGDQTSGRAEISTDLGGTAAAM